MTIALWVQPEELENSTSDLALPACRLASRVLFALTGRIYGGVKTTIEVYYPRAYGLGDSLRTLTLQRYGIGISCTSFPYRLENTQDIRIPLRRRPANAIESLQVVTTGAFVSVDDYWLSDSTYLTITPRVPAMAGLSVEYTYGSNPPAEGSDAAKSLADEFILMLSNSTECRLKNVTSYTRQGVSFQVEDEKTIISDGRTGIAEVDLFVESVNPARRGRSGATANRALLRSRVLSPDSFMSR